MGYCYPAVAWFQFYDHRKSVDSRCDGNVGEGEFRLLTQGINQLIGCDMD